MNMKMKLLIPIFALAMIICGMLTATLWVTGMQKNDGLVINLAGRQRMLTQKMSKEILVFQKERARTGVENEVFVTGVKNTMTIFEKTLFALTESGEAPLSLNPAETKTRYCPPAEEPAYTQLKKVGELWKIFSANMNSVLEKPDSSNEKLSWILQNNVPLLKAMNKAVGMMQQQSEGKVRLLILMQVSGILIGLVCILMALLLIIRISKKLNTIISSLDDAANHVADGSGAISSSSQTLADGASSQAASLEETSASIEEMSSMTKQNAENAVQANTIMKENQGVVSKANEAMEQLIGSMSDISKASEETFKIIKTIDEIAFQTNLLALNAAVEAARAGEAGAGFAVVADEVRNLAMRAADAAKNTSELIESTVKKISSGSEIAITANTAFNEVTEAGRKTGVLIEGISNASSEQAEGISQINVAVAEMDRVVQSTAAVSEESAGSAEEMSSQAEEMKAIVHELVLMVNGTNAADIGFSQEQGEYSAGIVADQDSDVKLIGF